MANFTTRTSCKRQTQREEVHRPAVEPTQQKQNLQTASGGPSTNGLSCNHVESVCNTPFKHPLVQEVQPEKKFAVDAGERGSVNSLFGFLQSARAAGKKMFFDPELSTVAGGLRALSLNSLATGNLLGTAVLKWDWKRLQEDLNLQQG